MEVSKICEYCRFQKCECSDLPYHGTCTNRKSRNYLMLTHYLDDCEQWEEEVEE